jgi:hypothetical protein
MSVNEKAVRIVTQMKSTNIVIAAFLIIAAFALISMPQMIVSADAQSEEASEHACPVPDYTLSKGECTAEPIIKYECIPSSLDGVRAELSGTTCTITADFASDIDESDCESEPIGGQFTIFKKLGTVTCTFDATEIGITCPGDVPPTEEGECITKPGRGNDPT